MMWMWHVATCGESKKQTLPSKTVMMGGLGAKFTDLSFTSKKQKSWAMWTPASSYWDCVHSELLKMRLMKMVRHELKQIRVKPWMSGVSSFNAASSKKIFWHLNWVETEWGAFGVNVRLSRRTFAWLLSTPAMYPTRRFLHPYLLFHVKCSEVIIAYQYTSHSSNIKTWPL